MIGRWAVLASLVASLVGCGGGAQSARPMPGTHVVESGGAGAGAPAPNPNLPASLTKSDISAGVARVLRTVEACAAKSSAKGTVKVAIRVAGTGTVSSVTVRNTPDPALGACVAMAMQRAIFAKTQTGGAFVYPFVF